MERHRQSEGTPRAVSVYGPFYIGNNCLKIPVTEEDADQNRNVVGNHRNRNTIDVSKYRIPTPNISDRRKNSTVTSSKTAREQNDSQTKEANKTIKDTDRQDNDTQTGVVKLKRYKDIGQSPELACTTLMSNGRPEARTKEHGETKTNNRSVSKNNVTGITASPEVNETCTEDKQQLMSTNNVKKDSAFKISSTEDNYVLNKYKSKILKTQEDYINKTNNSGETVSKKNSPREYFSKHRLKIAKLKRRFFESLSTRDTANESNAKNDSNTIDAYASNNEHSDSTADCDNTAKQTRDLPNTTENDNSKLSQMKGFATESKATMMKRYGLGTKDRQRRHSSEVILGNKSMFTDDNWSPRCDDVLTPYAVVVAIDFGTTYSGYAYSFIQDPEVIHLMRRQDGGDPGVFDQKIPTTILLTPDAQFHSFGHAARDFYHDLNPKEATKWMYFDRFKMLLHNTEGLTKDTMLKAISGREINAMKVFSYSLAYFKELVLQELTDQSSITITCDVIRWVITVPAIWKASAKQFMRMAAYEAGILSRQKPEQLLIALEPEAASLYCRRLRMLHLTMDNVKDSTPSIRTRSSLSLPDLQNESLTVRTDDLTVGTQYMVVDCGGGTVDITVHELLDGGRLKELHRATGGSHGSVGIDEEFEKLMGAIFGDDIVDQFKIRRPAGWVDLMAVFESRKRTASPYRTSHISVSLPFSFIDFYKKCRGNSVESAVKRFGDPDITWTSNGMLKLSPGTMRRLFLPTVNGIKQAIGDVLNDQYMQGLTYMFLVGGFAESSMVQHELREDFGSLVRVVIPPGVSMSILKGAVYFGLDPNVVEERCSCMTYGVGVLHRFDKNKHPINKLVSKDGVDWCTDIFDAFVHVNQSVAIGDSIVRRYTPVRRDQSVTVIHIYSTDRPDVTYVSDHGVMRCGTLSLKLDENSVGMKSDVRREIRTEMMFGGTEIKVMATDVTSGLSVESGIDFINN